MILAFDVKVNQEARLEADRQKVKIMTADIIYHLFDQFTAYMNQIKEAEKQKKMQGAPRPPRWRREYSRAQRKPKIRRTACLS